MFAVARGPADRCRTDRCRNWQAPCDDWGGGGHRQRRETMKIVVIGGTGLIGSKTVAILRQGGHDVVAASPNSGVNTSTGEGVKEALAGAQVVIDFANSPSFEDKAVLEFFETAGRTCSRRRLRPVSGTMSRCPSSQSTGPTMAISAPSSPKRN